MEHTLLLVDDEPALRAALRRTLRDEPYRILEAGGASEALALLEREPVSLVLSDQNMPGGTGLSLCAELRRTHPTVVRVLMTGAADRKQAAEALEEEVVYHVMQKPWELKELVLLVRLALRHRADLLELERLGQLVRAQRRIIAELEQAQAGKDSAAAP